MLEAEAWAEGEKAGVPVTSDDPQYNNNAKYWAGQASTAGAAAGAAAATPAAQAVVSDYSVFSIGSAYEFSVIQGSVKAARTVTKTDGTTESINIPGLVVFASPVPGEWYSGESYNSEYANADNTLFLPQSFYGSGSYDHFLLIPIDGPAAYTTISGSDYRLNYVRVYDITNQTWAADNTSIAFKGVAVNATRSTQISANNNANIGNALT